MISILLPTYNGDKYIDQTVQSILNQTCRDFELLVGLNGGSPDATLEKLSEFSDKRIKIFNYTHKGKPKTLNLLLDESLYEIIALIDDDDLWHAKKLETQLKLTETYDVVGSQILYIDEKGAYPTKIGWGPKLSTDSDIIHKLMLSYENHIANSAALIKKESIINVGGWNESLPALEDMDLWIRMLNNGCKFTNMSYTLMYHRIHKTSNFNSKKWDPEELLGYTKE
ncbi:hypothetical protein CL622_01510 [archaeon]|nr:hypothetical protein [archaeon]